MGADFFAEGPPVKLKLPLIALLLASTACTMTAPEPASTSVVAVDRAAEDARLNAFLDAAFDAQLATNPQFLTALGSKELYDRLNDYTDS